MAIINKTGITDGGTIQAEHVTRAIDALSGVSSDSIVATGSFTGSFTGPLTGTSSFATSASFSVSASRAVTSSYSLTSNTTRIDAGSDDSTHYVVFTRNQTGQNVPNSDANLTFNPSTNALTLTGSLTVSGSLNMTASPTSIVNFSAISSSGNFAIPLSQPNNPVTGSVYVDFTSGNFSIWDGATWRSISL